MTTLMEVFGVIGHGNRSEARRNGRKIGYSEVWGSQTKYYSQEGRSLGYSERDGGNVVLRENGGKTVARYGRG